MGKINTNNYPNRPVSVYQDDDMFILQDNGGETYTTNVGDIKTLIDNKISSSGKADKVSSATAGHLAGLDANGNLTDSGISVSNGTIRATELVTSDGVQANDISYFNEIDMDGSSISGVSTLNVNQIDVHDGQAVEFLTDVVVNGAVADEDGNVLSNKTDKVENATSGHLAGLDSNGNLTDSGVSPTEDVTVEGNPVSFDSPFEQDAKSVVVSVKPIQDLHGYDAPWVGGAGKNFLGIQDGVAVSNGITLTPIKDNADNIIGITLNGTATDNVDFWRFLGIDLAAGTERYITLGVENEIPGLQLVISPTWTGINPSKATTDAIQGVYISIWQGAVFDNVNIYPMICLNSETDKSFAPYSNICPISGIDKVEIEVSDGESEPTTTTIPLPSTLYGGTVRVDEGDADSTKAKVVFDGSDDEQISLINIVAGKGSRFSLVIPSDSITWTDAGELSHKLSSNKFKETTNWSTYDGGIGIHYRTNGAHEVVCGMGMSDVNTVELFREWLSNSPLQVCYELATPTTISFTPADVELLEGTNVVSTNGEKVAVTYGRSLWQDIDDLKTDTEGKLDKSDVADIEGNTASRPYSVNEFMLRSDGLYKVTQPIAQNASITASNTTKTTIGAVLTALLNS